MASYCWIQKQEVDFKNHNVYLAPKGSVSKPLKATVHRPNELCTSLWTICINRVLQLRELTQPDEGRDPLVPKA